jgi:pimeloyl-ACP methyl ester carboxylesterase
MTSMALDLDLHAETVGRGPAVLWIHGYTMDSSLWRPLWELLPGFRHVGVDLPGHGRSGPLRPDATLPGLAAQLAELAQAERARAVVAISLGSCLALQLAIEWPALIDRLAIGAATIAGAAAAPGTAKRTAELALLCRIAGAGPHLTELWMTSPPDIFRGTERHRELRARVREVIDRHLWTELSTGAMRSLTAHTHTDEDLGRITARTLVLTGDCDMPVFTANATRLGAAIAHCRVLAVPEAGHLCLLERPETVAQSLRDHLAGPA